MQACARLRGPMPELAFYRHGEELLRVALADRTTVGRAPECDVSLPDPELSRIHAEILQRGDTFHLVDRSGRGTRVGGELVAEAALLDGTDVALGAWRVLFRESAGEDDTPTRIAGGTSLRSAGEVPYSSAMRLRVRERGRERVFTIDGDAVIVGKDRANDVVLDDPFVSARHVRLEQRRGRWRIRDLGSTNGTVLAGVRVTEAELPEGAPVSIGDTELVLEASCSPRPPAAPFEGMISSDPAMRQVF